MNKYGDDYFIEVCKGLKESVATDKAGIVDMDSALEKWAMRARETQQNGGLVFFCGNGASCTMAEHMSHDWFQNAKVNTYTCSETSHITAISNDVSYEDVFSYRIDRILSKNDMLVTISSSGNSPNIVKAIKTAQSKGAFVVTLSGMKSDNKSRMMGDLNFYVPLPTYGTVESGHAVLLHTALDLFLDKYQGGRH